MEKAPLFIPQIDGGLRKHIIRMPECIQQASGIRIFGKRICSIIFSTDAAIIKNSNADAVIAVYPFTPQPAISHAILQLADVPVFCGVGGGTTTGVRVTRLAQDAEFRGAIGVVLNAPATNETVHYVAERVDIPVVITVVSEEEDVQCRLDAGAKILNVSGAGKTPDIVRAIRRKFPEVPIIATGGKTDETILRTIEAGANAVTFTPPTTAELFREMMNRYREQLAAK